LFAIKDNIFFEKNKISVYARFINLDDRPERLTVMNQFKVMSKYNLQRFSAIRLPTLQDAMQYVTPRARADLLGRLRMHHESINTLGGIAREDSSFPKTSSTSSSMA